MVIGALYLNQLRHGIYWENSLKIFNRLEINKNNSND